MAGKMIRVKVFRFDPAADKEPWYQTYQVPWEKGMSAMTALDYIYQNLDGTLAYYDHAACDWGSAPAAPESSTGSPGSSARRSSGGM